VRTVVLVASLLAACTAESTNCYDQSDCGTGYECSGYKCIASSCALVGCGTSCGEVDDGCGGTMSCGVCQGFDTCEGLCASTAHRIVFVTSKVYVGGMLGGLDGADAICQQHAISAHFTGMFRAWLSDSTGSPATRMTHGLGNYSLTDGVPIAIGWEDLISGQLMHSVHEDEHAGFHQGGTGCHMESTAWTGTDIDGTAYTGGTLADSCGNWDDPTSYGMIGNTNGSDLAWTLDCNIPCNYATSLYCVEQ
jgi:hypothetical protein